MAEQQYFAGTDGQEFAIADAVSLGQVSGLADDRVLAELLRLTPYDGVNVYKTVIPYGYLLPEGTTSATAQNFGTVESSGSANGSIFVFPFRAVVGSRTAASSSVLQNWRDIRSGIYTSAGPTMATTIALASNASGNPRWDLVYATLSVDVQSGTATRRVKTPGSGSVAATTVPTALLNPVTVTVLAGTPSATPVVPTLPADSGGNYNIALAAVYVPNGFTAGSAVLNANIRDQVKISALQSPTMGGIRLRPATGNTDQLGTYGVDTSGPGVWTSGVRPGLFLPPGLVGGESILAEVDLTTAAHPSHSVGSVVDDSVDWRNRYFLVFASANLLAFSAKFASDVTATTNNFPQAIPAGFNTSWGLQMSNSFTFWTSAGPVANSGNVWTGTGTSGGAGALPGGSQVSLYVDLTTGQLKWWNNGTATNARFFFWIMATAMMPNA